MEAAEAFQTDEHTAIGASPPLDEEEALGPILARDPAWGPARIARMLEEHAAEHRVLHGLLGAPPLELAARFADIADDLGAHMAAEERTILHPQALR